ncbi:MFS general substrate transporter [Trichoderma austrokoningii]
MLDIIREAPLGQAIRFVSRNKLLQYPEEKPDFKLPDLYVGQLEIHEKRCADGHASFSPAPGEGSMARNTSVSQIRSDLRTVTTARSVHTIPYSTERVRVEKELELECTKSLPIAPQKTSDGTVLVDWYTTDDPENPHNWSSFKKILVTTIICIYTFIVYSASSIYAPSVEGVSEHFGVSIIAAELGLALFVLWYGVGGVVFGPLSEIPVVGRNPVYYVTFIIYFGISFPTAVVGNFGGLLVLRSLQGGTFTDMYDLIYVLYQLCFWVYCAWGGPAIGPLIGGFSAMFKGWRWPLWEIVWMNLFMLVVMLCLLPETSAANLLMRRAKRLRKLAGDPRLQSQSEIDQQHLTASEILVNALVRSIEIIIKDPAILFVNVYTAFFYGVYYTFFEVFPLLRLVLSHISAIFTDIVPDNIKNGLREQEHRLVPALFGSILLQSGVVLFVIGMFWILQALFVYIPFSYPTYANSLFAGNCISRAAMVAGAIMYARPLFINLNVHEGVTLLAGLSVGGIPGTFFLYKYGGKLRARSKFAVQG